MNTMKTMKRTALAPLAGTVLVCALGLTLVAAEGAPPRPGAEPSGQTAPLQAADATYAFVDVNVLPMDRERVLEGQTVLVSDGVITEVAPTGDVQVPGDAVRIEGRGRWLMPGLAEMHAHVPPVSGGSDAWPDRQELEEILFLYVANGITTIRGMLGASYQLELREMLRDGEILGPTFYVGAPSLNGNSAPNPEAAEELIRRHHRQGYDFQKIHPGLSRETWDRMARVAEELGFTFAGHVPSAVGLEHALETGISTVDHLDGYAEALAPEELRNQAMEGGQVSLAELVESIDEARIPVLVRKTKEAGAWVVPTQYLWESLVGSPDPDELLALPEMRYVSPETREGWRRRATRGGAIPEDVAGTYHAARHRILRALAEADAGLLMGTDSPQLFNVPGFALHRELAVMEEADLTRWKILESGTRNVARYVDEELGKDGSFGTVAPGRRADLVLLEGNPLESLENLQRRGGVMVRGRWIPGEEIEEGLARIAARHAGGM